MAQMVEVDLNGRWRLKLPEHRQAQWAQPWEKERLESMYHELSEKWEICQAGQPGDRLPVVVDVGAEQGDMPALWSSWGCDVILIEPTPEFWPAIRATFEANDLRPPLEWWVGFAAEKTDVEQWVEDWPHNLVEMVDGARGFGVWPEVTHGPIVEEPPFSCLAQHNHIPKITLDELCWFNHLGRRVKVDAITIDVEGAELRVLRGAQRILREDRPLVWVSVHTDIEWMRTWYPGDNEEDVRVFMRGLGYIGHCLARTHEAHWLFEPVENLS